MVVSQASRQDVIIMKDTVLECHGVKRTTLGDFRGMGAHYFNFHLPVQFSFVVTPRNVMKQIKGCCRKRTRR